MEPRGWCQSDTTSRVQHWDLEEPPAGADGAKQSSRLGHGTFLAWEDTKGLQGQRWTWICHVGSGHTDQEELDTVELHPLEPDMGQEGAPRGSLCFQNLPSCSGLDGIP